MEIQYGVSMDYFLWSAALGGGLALVYDMLRAFRRVARAGTAAVVLGDILWFLLAGAALFWLAYAKNGGRLRWQGILGTASGVGLYRLVLRDWVVWLLVRGIRLLNWAAFWILRAALFPVRLVYKALKRPFLVVGWYSRQGVRRVGGALAARAGKRRLAQKRRRAQAAERRRRNRAESPKNQEDF